MTKRPAAIIALLLVLSLVAAPAAAKGKKKGPKPYKSPDVSILVPHPVLHSSSGSMVGVTPQEFMNSCSVPSSNGFDAYVFEVPESYRGIEAAVRAVGNASGPASYDLDIFLFDEACSIQVAYQAVGTDEVGLIFKDTVFVVVVNYLGDPNQSMHLELERA